MYSEEIKQYLELREYVLNIQEYIEVVGKSPQINSVKYNNDEDKFEISTDDRYNFKFKIKKLGE
jgi:hypothetical protein